MHKLVVDTNVLIDFFAQRKPFYRDAALLLFGCAMQDYEMWISSSQITDLHYLISKGESELRDAGQQDARQQAAEQLKQLRKVVRVAALLEDDVDKALNAGWPDFEDACVYFVARHLHANYVITRNKKDFAKSSIPVLTPAEYLALLSEERGLTYDEVDF